MYKLVNHFVFTSEKFIEKFCLRCRCHSVITSTIGGRIIDNTGQTTEQNKIKKLIFFQFRWYLNKISIDVIKIFTYKRFKTENDINISCWCPGWWWCWWWCQCWWLWRWQWWWRWWRYWWWHWWCLRWQWFLVWQIIDIMIKFRFVFSYSHYVDLNRPLCIPKFFINI